MQEFRSELLFRSFRERKEKKGETPRWESTTDRKKVPNSIGGKCWHSSHSSGRAIVGEGQGVENSGGRSIYRPGVPVLVEEFTGRVVSRTPLVPLA